MWNWFLWISSIFWGIHNRFTKAQFWFNDSRLSFLIYKINFKFLKNVLLCNQPLKWIFKISVLANHIWLCLIEFTFIKSKKVKNWCKNEMCGFLIKDIICKRNCCDGEQNVSDDLHVWFLYFLPEVSTLPS